MGERAILQAVAERVRGLREQARELHQEAWLWPPRRDPQECVTEAMALDEKADALERAFAGQERAFADPERDDG